MNSSYPTSSVPITAEALEAWALHRRFLRWYELPRFERLVALNAHAKGFGFNRQDFKQVYRAWAADRDFYIERYQDIERRYFSSQGGAE